MRYVALVDQDGHIVKLTKEEIAACLKEMGNTAGSYVLLTKRMIDRGFGNGDVTFLEVSQDSNRQLTSEPVIQFRARTRPKYSRFTLWRKKRMGSKLLDRKVPMMVAGRQQMVPQDAKPVWLRLKGKKVVTINVE